MRFTENRKIAFVVLAVCVVVSLFGFGGMSLARERGKVLTVYDRGVDASSSTRESLDAYLDAAAEEAGVMALEADLYLDSAQLTDSVSALAEQMAKETNIDARYDQYTQLKTQVDKLYNGLYGKVSDSEFVNFKHAYDDFWGYTDLIERNPYSKLAYGYNQLASGFPGGLVAGLTGNGALSTFGG